MLARVAENLYWLGRYLERAENQARLIDVQRVAQGLRIGGRAERLDFVLETLGASQSFKAEREQSPGLTPEEYLVYSSTSPHSIRTAIGQARGLAMEIRDNTSREVFEAINRLYHSVASTSRTGVSSSMTQQVRDSIATIFGLFENTVLHNEGAHWFRFGQLLERADMTSRIVDAKYFITLPAVSEIGGALDTSQWRGVLRSASALEAYHKSYLGPIRVGRVIDLLFLNPEFPRSLRYCIDAMRDEFDLATSRTLPARTLSSATELSVIQLELKALVGDRVVAEGLHEFIDRFQRTLMRVDESLTRNLFRAVLPVDSHSQSASLAPTASLQTG